MAEETPALLAAGKGNRCTNQVVGEGGEECRFLQRHVGGYKTWTYRSLISISPEI